MSRKGTKRNLWWVAWMTLALGLVAGSTQAAYAIQLWDPQTVYVPVYSHIYYGDRQGFINLTITLSVRNADPTRPDHAGRGSYYDSNGKLVEKLSRSAPGACPFGGQALFGEGIGCQWRRYTLFSGEMEVCRQGQCPAD